MSGALDSESFLLHQVDAIKLCTHFSFVDIHDADGDAVTQGVPMYIAQIHSLRDYNKTTLFVDFSHVLQHEEVLARAISQQYYR